MTADELIAACKGGGTPAAAPAAATPPPVTTPPPTPVVQGGATPLTCGQLKSLATTYDSRASVGRPEGAVAAQTVADHCASKPDESIPTPAIPPPSGPQGTYSFVRGYSNPPRDSGDTCASVYRGIAIVSNGRIAFDSDVYHWTGTVSSNGIIQIDTDGITPLPGHKPLKNKTAVSGAIGNASLFNGYCGYGYFRLS